MHSLNCWMMWLYSLFRSRNVPLCITLAHKCWLSSVSRTFDMAEELLRRWVMHYWLEFTWIKYCKEQTAFFEMFLKSLTDVFAYFNSENDSFFTNWSCSMNWYLIFRQIFQTFDGSSFLNITWGCEAHFIFVILFILYQTLVFAIWIDFLSDTVLQILLKGNSTNTH